ncbi:MAG: SDR family NAD(P)-dependent oxidoreductase [Caldilineales bacterium]|nr:SDR family NAD(P)-dependent oxidoreductase [Caldilineales bacterium]
MSSNGKWTAANIPDQTGRVIVITGANSGIGYEAALALAAKGGHVVVAGRNPEKCEQAAMDIRNVSPDCGLEVILINLADLKSIHTFAETFKQRHDRLDLLINNAGVMALPKHEKTADGFEMQFGTNHLGHYTLTGLLLDRVLATPNSRVVNVSSNAHKLGNIDFENLNAEKKYSQWGAYGASKLANLLFTYELQRRLVAHGSSTISVAAHPGYSATDLQRHSGVFGLLNHILAQSPQMGALPTLYAATAADVNGCDYIGPDRFFEQRGHPAKVHSNGKSHDEAAARRLWEVSEELTGVKYIWD